MTNCVLSAAGHGSRSVYAIRIDHGMSVVSNEDKARYTRGFYSRKRTSGSFSLTVQFPSWEDYNAFGEWLMEYGRKISDPENSTVGPIRVTCPARKFDKIAVPVSGITFGDDVGSITYSMNLAFKGTSGPLEFDSKFLSEFENSRHDIQNSIYYYPAGMQMGGGVDPGDPKEGIDGTIYNAPQNRVLPTPGRNIAV